MKQLLCISLLLVLLICPRSALAQDPPSHLGGGTVQSVQIDNTGNTLFTGSVSSSNYRPVLTFQPISAPNATLFGNFSGSSAAGQYVQLIEGSGITLTGTPTTLTISASGGTTHDLLGTANQVTVSGGTGSVGGAGNVTLSLPSVINATTINLSSGLGFNANGIGVTFNRGATLLDSGANAVTLKGSCTFNDNATGLTPIICTNTTPSIADMLTFNSYAGGVTRITAGGDLITHALTSNASANLQGGASVSSNIAFNANGIGLTFNRGATLLDSGTNAVTLTGSLATTLGYYLPPQTAPANPASGWVLYTDTSGGHLKAKASTGTVVDLGTP